MHSSLVSQGTISELSAFSFSSLEELLLSLSNKLGSKRLHLFPQSHWDDESTGSGALASPATCTLVYQGLSSCHHHATAELKQKPAEAECSPVITLLHQLPAWCPVACFFRLLRGEVSETRTPPDPLPPQDLASYCHSEPTCLATSVPPSHPSHPQLLELRIDHNLSLTGAETDANSKNVGLLKPVLRLS